MRVPSILSTSSSLPLVLAAQRATPRRRQTAFQCKRLGIRESPCAARLSGQRFLFADFAAEVTPPFAAQSYVPIADYTAIQRWNARLMDLPSWRPPFLEEEGGGLIR